MLQVQLEGRTTPMMVDTRATYMCMASPYASHLPWSGQFVKTIGFLGKVQMIPTIEPVALTLHKHQIQIPILVSD